MKAERRHELQHNELADWLAEAIEKLKPYSRAIVGVIVAAAVLLTTYVILSGRSERKQTTAWTDYYLAVQGAPENVESDLEAVMSQHEGVAAGRWAQVALADLKLGEGIKALFTDKTAAKKSLETAVEYYQAVIPEAEDPLLIARARFGLARALESLGELEKAREVYQQVVEASGTNAYISLAEERLKDLKRGSTQDFYAWFQQQEPAAAPPAGSSSLPGTPGLKLPFEDSALGTPGDVNLSGDSILDLPELQKGPGPLLTPPTSSDNEKTAPEAAKETPEASDAKGDTSEPANEKPAPKPEGDAESQPKESQSPDQNQSATKEPVPATGESAESK
jgi:hypothetical protein